MINVQFIASTGSHARIASPKVRMNGKSGRRLHVPSLMRSYQAAFASRGIRWMAVDGRAQGLRSTMRAQHGASTSQICVRLRSSAPPSKGNGWRGFAGRSKSRSTRSSTMIRHKQGIVGRRRDGRTGPGADAAAEIDADRNRFTSGAACHPAAARSRLRHRRAVCDVAGAGAADFSAAYVLRRSIGGSLAASLRISGVARSPC